MSHIGIILYWRLLGEKMVMNLSAGAARLYEDKLNKLIHLFETGILPAKVKELVEIWFKKLGVDALKTEDRTRIDALLEDGLNREQQEKRRINNNVRQGY